MFGLYEPSSLKTWRVTLISPEDARRMEAAGAAGRRARGVVGQPSSEPACRTCWRGPNGGQANPIPRFSPSSLSFTISRGCLVVAGSR